MLRQMAKHGSVRLQRAFWIAGRAGSKIQKRRIVCGGVNVGEIIASRFERNIINSASGA